jgi:hypothetical protein
MAPTLVTACTALPLRRVPPEGVLTGEAGFRPGAALRRNRVLAKRLWTGKKKARAASR